MAGLFYCQLLCLPILSPRVALGYDASMKKFTALAVFILVIAGVVFIYKKASTPPTVAAIGTPDEMIKKAKTKALEKDPVVKEDEVEAPPQVPEEKEASASSGDRNQKFTTPSAIDLGGRDRPLTEEEMDQLEAYYERTEKEWDQTVSKMFKDFGLPAGAFAEYQKMREAYEEAKMDAFQEYHNKMIEKYGDSYEYNPADEQDVFDEKVIQKANADLKKFMGERNFQVFSQKRESFNDRIRKEQNPDLGIMLMDF